MITVKQSGDFSLTEKFLKNAGILNIQAILESYGRKGVEALKNATPVDSGLTANSWGYEILKTKNGHSIVWTNSNIVNGVPIAILLQYGHATGTGGYVTGTDYINPALKSIFNNIANDVWKAVIRG